IHHGALENDVHRAGTTVFGQAGAEAQYLRVLAQPGVDVALDHRLAPVHAYRLAMGDAHAANFQPGGFGEKLPQRIARLFDAHAVQVEAAIEGNLAELELAHLAFLHAVCGPVQGILGTDVDDELIGQAIHLDFALADGRSLTQGVELLAIGFGFAGVGAVVLERFYAAEL